MRLRFSTRRDETAIGHSWVVTRFGGCPATLTGGYRRMARRLRLCAAIAREVDQPLLHFLITAPRITGKTTPVLTLVSRNLPVMQPVRCAGISASRNSGEFHFNPGSVVSKGNWRVMACWANDSCNRTNNQTVWGRDNPVIYPLTKMRGERQKEGFLIMVRSFAMGGYC